MSITDLEKIDGAGIDNEKSDRLNLMIADNLDWVESDVHLEILTDKLNNYYNYIKSRQYLSNWSGIKEFMIIIYFKYTPNDAANTYLKKVSEQLKGENIFIKLVID
ncbi:hypothetical protein KQ224_00440 [Streptococcus parasuis]|uniref:DUF6572 domain-containing protein n=1 Tax=Streptococcus parasuis TaxID=1501662 RepID=UPI001C1F3E3E|nr:DUF6572 domain-containing protein [Streptococcus parasuis]QWV86642.1 hypothetical protein KQ224_00440 [Streptococcus parasuis]